MTEGSVAQSKTVKRNSGLARIGILGERYGGGVMLARLRDHLPFPRLWRHRASRPNGWAPSSTSPRRPGIEKCPDEARSRFSTGPCPSTRVARREHNPVGIE